MSGYNQTADAITCHNTTWGKGSKYDFKQSLEMFLFSFSACACERAYLLECSCSIDRSFFFLNLCNQLIVLDEDCCSTSFHYMARG